MSKISVAEHAGFCFGVDRAVKIVYRLLSENKKVCTLGQIIHNPQIVKEFADRGVLIVDTPKEVPAGYTLVLRSHGVPKQVIDELIERGIDYEDATCPFVSKIHRIVDKNTDENTPLIIAGDKNHVEVQGIMSYAKGEIFCVENAEELESLLNDKQYLAEKPLCAVAQTTFNKKIWEKIYFLLKKDCTNAKIFGTICDATEERQKESLALAEECDLMIVIGGRHSSNTNKLFEICNAKTKTLFIEDVAELDKNLIKSARFVGVTAGASTPAVIIKEVLNTMTELMENTVNEKIGTEETVKAIDDNMSFEEALEVSLNNMNHDKQVVGTVIAVGPTEVQVDIGRKQTGIVPASELSNDTTKKPEELVKVGDEINLIIMKTNDVEGIITLSKRRYDAAAGMKEIMNAKDTEEILTGTVTAVVKGGLTVISNGVRVFVPASHATLTRKESLDDMVGNEVQFRVIDIRRGRSVVGSIRSVLREQIAAEQEKIWSTIEVGAKYTGVVKSLTSYGAFVDIGGVDGMIHITELSWSKIKHPSEVVNEGDTVEVYVKDIDTEKKKISLGFKRAEDNPWEILKTKYNEGDVAEVKIVSMTTYGAFANLIPGIDGLIHISQIADRRIEKPQDVLKIGDVVTVKITKIDFEAKRVSLSIRALIESETVAEEAPSAEEEAEGEVMYSTEDAE